MPHVIGQLHTDHRAYQEDVETRGIGHKECPFDGDQRGSQHEGEQETRTPVFHRIDVALEQWIEFEASFEDNSVRQIAAIQPGARDCEDEVRDVDDGPGHGSWPGTAQ